MERDYRPWLLGKLVETIRIFFFSIIHDDLYIMTDDDSLYKIYNRPGPLKLSTLLNEYAKIGQILDRRRLFIKVMGSVKYT